MKKILIKSIAIVAVVLTLVSCSKNEDTVSGEGNLKIEFENGYAGNALILGSPTVASSQNEVLKISSIKYIISNIVLTKTDGTTYTYPKSQSYFIVDELTPASKLLNLSSIPAGDYKSIKFGIGVDETQFAMGASGQGDLWTVAQAAGMTWSWASGYKFLAFEGSFTAPTASMPVTTDTPFMVHTGKTGTDYNYTEVSLALPTNALVRTTITPQIHLSTDLAQVLDGTNKISLASNNGMGMGAMIMGGANLPLITANLAAMFAVEHVHNDPN